MILTQADGTRRELSSDELRGMIRNYGRRLDASTPIESFDAFAARQHALIPFTTKLLDAEPDHLADHDRGIAGHFVVDADSCLAPLPLWQRSRRRAASLRSILLSVSVAALAGFLFAGFF